MRCVRIRPPQADIDAAEAHFRAALAAAPSRPPAERTLRPALRERLALLLLQEGRDADAAKLLRLLGCRFDSLRPPSLPSLLPAPGALWSA